MYLRTFFDDSQHWTASSQAQNPPRAKVRQERKNNHHVSSPAPISSSMRPFYYDRVQVHPASRIHLSALQRPFRTLVFIHLPTLGPLPPAPPTRHARPRMPPQEAQRSNSEDSTQRTLGQLRFRRSSHNLFWRLRKRHMVFQCLFKL